MDIPLAEPASLKLTPYNKKPTNSQELVGLFFILLLGPA